MGRPAEGAARPAAAPGRAAVRRPRARRAGGARAARASWSDAIQAVRDVADRARRPDRGPGRDPAHRGTRAAAPRSSSGSTPWASPVSCTPRSARRTASPRAARPPRSTSTCCWRTPARRSGPELSSFPVAKVDVALVVDDAVTAQAPRRHPARGRRPAAGVGPALRRLHRRPGRRGQEVAGVRAALPGARPDAHRRRGDRRPRRRCRPGRRSATEPPSAPDAESEIEPPSVRAGCSSRREEAARRSSRVALDGRCPRRSRAVPQPGVEVGGRAGDDRRRGRPRGRPPARTGPPRRTTCRRRGRCR